MAEQDLDRLFDEAEDLDAQFEAADDLGVSAGPAPDPRLIEDDSHLFDEASGGNFSFEEPKYQPINAGPSQAKAAGSALVSGATGGYNDEMGGAFQANMQLGSIVSDAIYPDELLQWFRNNGIGSEPVRDADGNAVSPLEIYRQGRDSNRRDSAELEEAYPKTTFGLQVLGGALNPVTRAASPMTAGAAFGLGFSEGDLTTGEPVDALHAADDAAFGAITGKALHTLASVAGSRFANTSIGRSVIDKFDDWVNKPSKKLGEWASNQYQKIAKQAKENVDSAYAAEKGRIGPIVAELNRDVEYLVEPIGGDLGKSVAKKPKVAAKIAEVRANQVPKKEQHLLDTPIPTPPKPPTQLDVNNEIQNIIAGDVNTAQRAVANRLGEKAKSFVYKLPGGVGESIKATIDLGSALNKTFGQRGTLYRLFTKARNIAKIDQGALGRYANTILNSADPAVTDYVLSQVDPEWRELKRQIEEEPDDEQ